MGNDNDPLRSERRLARIYVLALLLIASIAIATHTLIDVLITSDQQSAHVVDVAGRQRMLSQRISVLVLEMARAQTAERKAELGEKLATAMSEMAMAHQALVHGAPERGIPQVTSSALTAIYFDPPRNLDQAVIDYLSMARQALVQESGDGRSIDALADRISTARDGLLDSLNAAVRQYVVVSEKTVSGIRISLWVLLAALLLTIAMEGQFIFRPAFQRLLARTRELYDMARTDPLTGSHNRRAFVTIAEGEFDRVRRYGTACSVLMLDIDRFKAVNDTYGHHVGDEVIRVMAGTCVTLLRRSDAFGRLGGEEFAVLLPETGLDMAAAVAEKLRAGVEGAEITLPDGGRLSVTVSIGVAVVHASDDGIHETLERADNRLYEAKRTGRNRVCLPVSLSTGEADPGSGLAPA